MDVEIYDTKFNLIKILDIYESVLWNIKYNEAGDFTLVIPDEPEITQYMAMDNYISIPTSDRLMIIEKQEPNMDVSDGNMVTISGRSLESILDRRIIWVQTILSGNLQNVIKRLINDAIISPSIASRKISNFVFKDSTDTNVTSKKIDQSQWTGDNLYEVICKLCKEAKIGFKITLNDSHQFVFELYSGVDRTNNQLTYPTVEFSLNNDNLISSSYVIDKTNYKNITLIAGEGEGLERKTATYGNVSGLTRRELYTDARDLSTNDGEISDSEYQTQLIERGKQKLNECQIIKEIDSEVDNNEYAMYKLHRDYNLGDVVEVIDFGKRVSTSRIAEITTVVSSSEISTYPIFECEEIKED